MAARPTRLPVWRNEPLGGQLHIGMVYAKGNRADYADGRIQVRITNLRRLGIPPIQEPLGLRRSL